MIPPSRTFTLQDYDSVTIDGRDYDRMRVMFGGNTAGQFGSVMELRNVAVVGGMQYTLRVTTTRYKWLAERGIREMLKSIVASFSVVP